MNGAIPIHTEYFPPSDPALPAFALQIIKLVDSYMIWVGTTDVQAEEVDRAMGQGNLCKNWAYGLPTKMNCVSAGADAIGTSLFGSADSDTALSMAQRLGRRIGKPVFVSVDIGERGGYVGGVEVRRELGRIEREIVKRVLG
ncbi:hypothetical protein AMATHDRAFT_136955 [Amanita thiersii Skay4041]|uniref:Uncharacterized protein n=1 Tax=Amanita thiersii Skay4041 TaxID=703135 RepID=A0A2A9P0E9_9AGAR|nr:hypothetical protein AMATHDRAFT_136955 [Amanita thiersii Skay4041]